MYTLHGMGLTKVLRSFLEDPIFFWIRLYSLFYVPFFKIKKGVSIARGFTLKGKPIFEIYGSGTISIGANVTLYSTSRQYFAHFSSPVRLFVEEKAQIRIGDNVRINGATIHARKHVIIGNNCLIAANTSIIDSNGHSSCLDNPDDRVNSIDNPLGIYIEDSVWIGVNCVILKGVRIGYGSIITAGSVVRTDIPPFSIACGNPAKVVKSNKTSPPFC